MSYNLSRRALLATGASLALPRALRAQGAVFDMDVIVIGAGAAGLAAGRELQRQGRRFVILEARDRTGGRVHTERSLGAAYDAGALYIHWAERNPWREIARAQGTEAVPDNLLPRGRSLWFDQGEAANRNRGGVWRRLSDLFDTDVAQVPDVSIIDRVQNEPELRRGAMGMARMSLGDEPEHVSALDYARLWSGDDLVVPSGYGTLVQSFGEGLPVRLGTAVQAIQWGGPGVVVETAGGRLTAAATIVTVPVGVLQHGTIRFDPALPEATRAGLDGLAMGALTKIGLAFSGDRFDLPPNSNLWDGLGERAGFSFECWPYDRDVIIAYFGGDHAREVLRNGEKEAVDYLLQRLDKLIGPRVRPAFTGARVHAWMQDPFAMGCYSHALPGHADARAALARPVADRIFFAGEATAAGEDGSFGAAMTVGGAYLAGVAAAQAVGRLRGI
jgi:monoamine oxidase